jgi:hypothetical protein
MRLETINSYWIVFAFFQTSFSNLFLTDKNRYIRSTKGKMDMSLGHKRSYDEENSGYNLIISPQVLHLVFLHTDQYL